MKLARTIHSNITDAALLSAVLPIEACHVRRGCRCHSLQQRLWSLAGASADEPPSRVDRRPAPRRL